MAGIGLPIVLSVLLRSVTLDRTGLLVATMKMVTGVLLFKVISAKIFGYKY